MNQSPQFRPLLALAALLLLAACGGRSDPPPLQGATMGGPINLIGGDGRRVSDSQFAGRYRIVYFGFTFCPDVCPVDLALIGAGLRRFEAEDAARAARVTPIFISVDPARDTPAVVGAYAARFHPRIVALTGSEEEVAQVARRYAIYYQRQPPAQPGGAYLVDHSRQIVLYGPEGEPIAILPHDQGIDAFVAELRRWVR
ncbi:SCO family protein [Sphingosinicella sp.]|uniref:SCO family protein n=1 Tax=Sphingosinicella sp. TaxID=1917971 RepID=UPI004037C3D0